MSDEFGGDVLLTDTPDGGTIEIFNGLVSADRSFSTAVYISLFGGNEADGGRVDNAQTWWGNRFGQVPENERIVSRFQSLIRTMPLTGKNILLAEQAAVADLSWLKDDGIADEISAEISAVDRHRIALAVIVKKSGELLEKGNFTVQWEAAADGI